MTKNEEASPSPLPEWPSLCFDYRQNFGFAHSMFESGRLLDMTAFNLLRRADLSGQREMEVRNQNSTHSHVIDACVSKSSGPRSESVRPARLPSSWLGFLCFQLVMIVGVSVGATLLAALPAATLVVFLMIGLFLSFVEAPGLKNEATLLLQFPFVKKCDGIDHKMLAGLLSVEQDLLTDFVFENGFDVTATQTVAAIDALKQGL